MFTIYSKDNCAYCTKAIKLLRGMYKKREKIKVLKFEKDYTKAQLLELIKENKDNIAKRTGNLPEELLKELPDWKSGNITFPQIFYKNIYIGNQKYLAYIFDNINTNNRGE